MELCGGPGPLAGRPGGPCSPSQPLPRRELLRPLRAGSGSAPDSYSDEFARLAHPERSRQLREQAKHLDLLWNVSKARRPSSECVPCDCCTGSGRRECRFCGGTGALTLAGQRFCSLAHGCKPCPACKSTGLLKCKHCNGLGQRASWMERGCPSG